MNIKESTRKYILASFVVFVVGSLIVANVLAKKQDEVFSTEDILYQQAIQLYEEGNYSDAQTLISDLITEKADSEMVNYLAALITGQNGDFSAAVVFMQKVLDINPYNVERPIFMLQFGEMLFSAQKYEEAKIVLQRCVDAGWAPDDYPGYQEQVQGMLLQMENMQ